VRPGGPVAFCAAHLPQALAERLPADMAEQMHTARVVPLVEKYCGVQAFRVQQASSAIAAGEQLAARLQVEPGSPLLLLSRAYFDVEGTPIYYSDLYVRSDRYVHKIELFRHRQQVELARSDACRPRSDDHQPNCEVRVMKKPFHLAWFLSQGYGPKSWRGDWPGSDMARWMMPDLFVDLAKGMDRRCFDYMIIEDSSNVPYTYKGSHDTYLQYAASAPKLDPAVLVPYLAQATKNLGIVPTLSVSEYPPYLMARLVNSLDHVTEGRVGWNCVTGSNDGAAQNLRPRQAHAARRALRHRRRVRRCRDPPVGGVGT